MDMLLTNNGPIAFWSPALAVLAYADAGMEIQSCERVGRTYANGTYGEYLALTAERGSSR